MNSNKRLESSPLASQLRLWSDLWDQLLRRRDETEPIQKDPAGLLANRPRDPMRVTGPVQKTELAQLPLDLSA